MESLNHYFAHICLTVFIIGFSKIACQNSQIVHVLHFYSSFSVDRGYSSSRPSVDFAADLVNTSSPSQLQGYHIQLHNSDIGEVSMIHYTLVC